jgi:hypothetical protein
MDEREGSGKDTNMFIIETLLQKRRGWRINHSAKHFLKRSAKKVSQKQMTDLSLYIFLNIRKKYNQSQGEAGKS